MLLSLAQNMYLRTYTFIFNELGSVGRAIGSAKRVRFRLLIVV